jgi:hypothetical protein
MINKETAYQIHAELELFLKSIFHNFDDKIEFAEIQEKLHNVIKEYQEEDEH